MTKQSIGNPIDILIVEDNGGDARFVREMLSGVANLDIHLVDRLAAGRNLLKRVAASTKSKVSAEKHFAHSRRRPGRICARPWLPRDMTKFSTLFSAWR